MEKTDFKVLGMMSGTSLDGLDLALCNFKHQDGVWQFEIDEAETVSYPYELVAKLERAHTWKGEDLTALDFELGAYFGRVAKNFLIGKAMPDFISSHGHTILHNPSDNYTLQIGKAEAIAAATGVDVISDFRTMDVALGGQGAPLVPIGDRRLFGKYAACVNLGGFANISFEENGERVAYDVGPANMLLNTIVRGQQLKYDKGGALAREGKVSVAMLAKWNAKEYFKKPYPKSLGKEWFEAEYADFIIAQEGNSDLSNSDLLATAVEHIAVQLANSLAHVKGQFLFTGGGTHNNFLMERLQTHMRKEVVIPEAKLIDFKEALVFAFLSVLRIRGESNVLKSVTGGRIDHSAGSIIKAPVSS